MIFIKSSLLKLSFSVFTLFFILSFLGAQGTKPNTVKSSTEKTVEESYLSSTAEDLIIKEQVDSDSREMKLLGISYARAAVEAGRKSDSVRASMIQLVTEAIIAPVRTGGLGRRPINDFADIRARACDILADLPGPDTTDALITVVNNEDEPMVLAAAVRALGKIGNNENDRVTTAIAYVLNKFTLLKPDNGFAFEVLVAFRKIAEKNHGLKDRNAFKAMAQIYDGNYITPVRKMAQQTRDALIKISM